MAAHCHKTKCRSMLIHYTGNNPTTQCHGRKRYLASYVNPRSHADHRHDLALALSFGGTGSATPNLVAGGKSFQVNVSGWASSGNVPNAKYRLNWLAVGF